jgi:hypothetical protein
MENNSEVAKLRQRIEDEYTAAQRALHAPAMVAKHEFITKRMEGMQQAHAELQAIVGEHEAIKLVAATLENIKEVRPVQG